MIFCTLDGATCWRQTTENDMWRHPSKYFPLETAQLIVITDFNFKLAPSAYAVIYSYRPNPTETGPNKAMSSITDSPNKTFTTLQNVIDCPSHSAVVDLYAEVAAAATSAAQDASEEAHGGAGIADDTTGTEAPAYVIEDFVYFDPSASIKYEYKSRDFLAFKTQNSFLFCLQESGTAPRTRSSSK